MMNRLMMLSLAAFLGMSAVEASAQGLLRAPSYALQTEQPAPTIADPALPPVPAAPYAAPAAQAPGAYAPAYPAASQPVALYRNVRVRDQRKIHPCAVPTIVEVPDPCNPCCCVYIEICAPPCECLCVRRGGLFGRKIVFDYGKYEVDVRNRNGCLIIDYDA